MQQAAPNPITKAAAYWVPAFAGMTVERRLRLANFIQKGRLKAGAKLAMTK